MNPFTPNFENAKVGDACFSVMNDECEINDILFDTKYKIITSDGEAYTKYGCLCTQDIHPTLFNSFQQFMDYWQWEKDNRGEDA